MLLFFKKKLMSILIYYFNENIYVIYFFKNTSEVRLKKEIGFPKKKRGNRSAHDGVEYIYFLFAKLGKTSLNLKVRKEKSISPSLSCF